MSKSTILIDRETRKLLKRVGRKEQTYDELIRELVRQKLKCMIERKRDLFGYGIESPTTKQISVEPIGVGTTA